MATAEQGGTPAAAVKQPAWAVCFGEDSDEVEYPIAYTLSEKLDELLLMSPEAMDKQYDKVHHSEGFDSDAYAINVLARYLGPCRLGPKEFICRMDRLRWFCDTAINSFNIDHGTNLKVVEVVKANSHFDGMAEEFYITFTAAPEAEAKEDSGAASLYQAKAILPLTFLGPPKVFFCRPKPSSS